mmetsp:Transcript_88268/g.175415  ORF Transcript_88268/g.175415 Transcript_88268/m.175415 type:complete len:373 (-) Transcript_88268:1-1119(-)
MVFSPENIPAVGGLQLRAIHKAIAAFGINGLDHASQCGSALLFHHVRVNSARSHWPSAGDVNCLRLAFFVDLDIKANSVTNLQAIKLLLRGEDVAAIHCQNLLARQETESPVTIDLLDNAMVNVRIPILAIHVFKARWRCAPTIARWRCAHQANCLRVSSKVFLHREPHLVPHSETIDLVGSGIHVLPINPVCFVATNEAEALLGIEEFDGAQILVVVIGHVVAIYVVRNCHVCRPSASQSEGHVAFVTVSTVEFNSLHNASHQWVPCTQIMGLRLATCVHLDPELHMVANQQVVELRVMHEDILAESVCGLLTTDEAIALVLVEEFDCTLMDTHLLILPIRLLLLPLRHRATIGQGLGRLAPRAAAAYARA